MKRNTTKKPASNENSTDSTYFLKLVLYIVVATLWVKFASPLQIGPILVNGLPLGLGIGLMFAMHDHFRIDRKIEYAVLVVMTILTYFAPAGIVL